MHMLSGILGASAPYAKTAAGATAATGAVGMGAFTYNRANYMFDQGLRFGRYTAGYSFAMTQAAMYREDIRDMTGLTCSKQDLYHVVGVIFFVLNFQLIMAGRLGVHGPSPPGWLLSIYWANACCALMFLTLYNWLAMHASARAQAGGAYMLTRHVRLPIPTPKQLDKARKTGNSFERTRATDMFRVPFVAPAPKQATGEGSDGEPSYKAKSDKPRKAPRWYQSDEVGDLHAGEGGAAPSRNSTPEHFELYRGLQTEWWAHDAYARIGMLYFMSHWLTAASLYTMCHAFGELRAMWPAWTSTIVFCTAHRAILACDIVTDNFTRVYNFKVEKLVPWTPLICALGMSLDYSVITPSSGWMAVIYVLSWICYAIHVAWAFRLYDLACPTKPTEEMVEAAGQPWWPAEWHVPQAFQNCIYLVAPPKRLEPGQTCLQQEMKAAKTPKTTAAAFPKKAKDSLPVTWPWKLFRGAVLVCIGTWIYICIGRVIEQVNGERMFLKQEGRVMRWPSHMQPWMTPWSRIGTRNEYCHTGGCDRRLMTSDRDEETEMMQQAQELLSFLDPLTRGLTQSAEPAVAVPVQKLVHRLEMKWSGKQAPALIASGNSGSIAALSRGHEGMLVPEQAKGGEEVPFVLAGIEALGEVLGASWGEHGLLVTTASGALAECHGLPREGAWDCQRVGETLPQGGSALAAASAARSPTTGQLFAAVAFKGEESSITLFREEKNQWLPAGEISVGLPTGLNPQLSLSRSVDELLISTGDGGALKWAFGSDVPVRVAAAKNMGASSEQTWHSVSNCGGNRLAHLSMRRDGQRSLPELLIASH